MSNIPPNLSLLTSLWPWRGVSFFASAASDEGAISAFLIFKVQRIYILEDINVLTTVFQEICPFPLMDLVAELEYFYGSTICTWIRQVLILSKDLGQPRTVLRKKIDMKHIKDLN